MTICAWSLCAESADVDGLCFYHYREASRAEDPVVERLTLRIRSLAAALNEAERAYTEALRDLREELSKVSA